ncbi:hypothetical protein [Enhygromyxa salina]|uniref:hypothetical protein n=1 Tax=Enhygromyxa salina TaxID=215803 RepID=UPI0011B1C724|nr:hypothetical protein [Enhygromyxa salina]
MVPFVLLDYDLFERAAAHELVHARLADQPTVPLFSEGVAEAVSPLSCTRSLSPDLVAADFRIAKSGYDLGDIVRGYYVSGELTAWLLEEFGASAFLQLYADVDYGSSASTIATAYRRHFDREIVDDLFAHVRTQVELDALPPEHFGCLAPPPPTSDGVISRSRSTGHLAIVLHSVAFAVEVFGARIDQLDRAREGVAAFT